MVLRQYYDGELTPAEAEYEALEVEKIVRNIQYHIDEIAKENEKKDNLLTQGKGGKS